MIKAPTQPAVKATRDPERLISALLEISYLVGSVMRLDDILNRIARIAADLMQVPVCSIYLLQPDRSLLMISNVGLEPELRGELSIPWGEGIAGWVARNGEMVSLDDATNDPHYRIIASTIYLGCRAHLSAPLRIQDEIVGVMSIQKMEVYRFTQEERKIFETICKQVAIVIEKARMYDEKIRMEQLAAVAVSLGEVAHYIKNVLFTTQIGERIINDALTKPDGTIERVKEGWRNLQEANAKIRKLVESMLNYCRQTRPEFQAMDINVMIAKVVAGVAGMAERHRVQLVTELDPDLAVVSLEPDSMYDALLNLVTNAVDAIPEDRTDRRVVIRTHRIEGQNNYRIEVSDTGMGIPEEIQGKIFNLFFSTKGRQGTGIGLAATKKVVAEHDGTIEFTSRVGQGTCFTVFLPVWRTEEMP